MIYEEFLKNLASFVLAMYLTGWRALFELNSVKIIIV